MNKEEIIDYLKSNLKIKLSKERDWNCDKTIIRLILNDEIISKDVLKTSKSTGLPIN